MIYEKNERMSLRDTANFKITNKIWNDLSLNHAWSIGYLTYLCKQSGAKSFSQWEDFYFENGRDRLVKIQELSDCVQQVLLNRNIYKERKGDQVNTLTQEQKSINTHMGRTLAELKSVARELYDGVKRRGLKYITLEDCENYTYIRVLDETWIGIERELNTKKSLENMLDGYEVRDVPIEVDVKYAVDFEVYKEDNLVLAVQVKSHKYRANTSGVSYATKNMNSKKNEEYKKVTGVSVLNVYSEVSGKIYNSEEIDKYL